MLMHNLTIPSDELVLDDQTTHIQHIPSTPHTVELVLRVRPFFFDVSR